MNINKFMYTHPIFRLDELELWRKQQGSGGASSLHSSVNYYIKSGKIKRLRRQLYGTVSPNETVDTVQYDPYLIAAKVSKDSVLAYHTALELHSLAYSVFGQFTFLTSSKIKPFELESNWFQPVLTPKPLKERGNSELWIQEINRQGLTIKITNLARTFVDVLDRPYLCGGWEEVCRSINNIAVLDTQDVLEYCKIRDNATLNAKVGYFWEQRQGAFAPTKEVINTLLEGIPQAPQYIGKKGQEQHRLIKKWNLMVPEKVVEQSWIEPDHDI